MLGIVAGAGDNRGQDRIIHGSKERLSPQHLLSKTGHPDQTQCGKNNWIESFALD